MIVRWWMVLAFVILALGIFVLGATASEAAKKCKPAPMGCLMQDDWVDGLNKRGCIRGKGKWKSQYNPLDGDKFCRPKGWNARREGW